MLKDTEKNTLAAKGKAIDRRISVAPMMGWTDRHDRYFLRQIAPNTLLYTVMLTTGALIHGDDRAKMLGFNNAEHPLALQLGGSDPTDLGICAKYGEEFQYDEINLNCGCPSDRVQNGNFGACLMKDASLVANCIDAMKQKVDIPVTIKCRIGVDEFEGYDFLTDFIGQSADKGCDTFIIHARKAWLQGLSPKDNRTIPPLDYDIVYRLKRDFPQLNIILNGGLKTTEQIFQALEHTDGVMIGREAYQNPYMLSELEHLILKTPDLPSRHQVLDNMMPYIQTELEGGVALKDITRHMLGLFQGIPGARKWRRILSENAYKTNAKSDLLRIAVKSISV